MEVGAVKQAFNNELILLKKRLHQAKTQIIHNLTRKAKTLTTKKGPDKILQKNKRKAEAAVREILIMKKIKARDIGKFIVTHTGNLQDYINKPEVDENKACARILLHKAMQEKYTVIRNRFTDVPIKDLFMSRQERVKLKKEAKQKQKEKEKKKRDKQKKKAETENGWNVEDIEMVGGEKNKINEDHDISDDKEMIIESDVSSDFGELTKCDNSPSDLDDSVDQDMTFESDDCDRNDECKEMSDENEEIGEFGKFVKITHSYKKTMATKEPLHKENMTLPTKNILDTNKKVKRALNINKKITSEILETKVKLIEKEIKKKQETKLKVNKNKNFNEKILQRKFKKDVNKPVTEGNKVVDPFFITSTGENYMSVAEPRLPDEVKEIHKQGNRKQRRAAMFGHVTKPKPRKDEYSKTNYSNNYNKFDNQKDDRFNKLGKFNNDGDQFNSNLNTDKFNKDSQFSRTVNKREKHNGIKKMTFEDEEIGSKKSNLRNSDGRNPRWNQENADKEKLHPSWEAKKRQSGILPFQGKKIVFGED